jgi:gamma-glutamyltranspeptidase
MDQLRLMGHVVEPRPTVGSAPSILRRGTTWTGSADPRTGGLGAGS